VYLPDLDINRYNISINDLTSRPDIFYSVFPWFIFDLAAVKELSHAQWEVIQTVLVSLNLIPILSVYVVSKAFFGRIDRRIPILATLFFFIFAGFGWLGFLQLKSEDTNSSQYMLLARLKIQSHGDIGSPQAQSVWLWFRDLSLGLTICLALLYMLRREPHKKWGQIAVSVLLLVTLSQVHMSEFIIFGAFLFFLSIVGPRTGIRIQETSLSMLIALPLVLALAQLHAHLGYADAKYGSLLTLYLIPLAGLMLASLFLARTRKIKWFDRLSQGRLASQGLFARWSTFVAALLICLSVVIWIINIDQGSAFSELYAVPLHYYPVLLGVVGIFGVVAFIRFRNKPESTGVIPFLVLFLLALILGRTISFVNTNYFLTGYWERRLVEIAFLAAAMAAPLTLLRISRYFAEFLRDRKWARSNPAIKSCFVGGIVLIGTASSFISLEHNTAAIERLAIDKKSIPEFQDNYTTVLTLDNPSQNIAELSNAAYVVDRYRETIWTSQYPEYPLYLLNRLNAGSAIYTVNDNFLDSRYNMGYVRSHLMSIANVDTLADQSRIYNLQPMIPPSPRSNTVLVIPNELDPKIHFAYDLLSLSGYNYTTSLLGDEQTMRAATTIVAPTEAIAVQVMESRDLKRLSFKNLLIMNAGGVGPLTKSSPIALDAFDLDMEDSSSWEGYAVGKGHIGVPELTTSKSSYAVSDGYESNKTFIVRSGENLHWGLARHLSQPVDVANHDEIEIEWLGNGDASWYVIEVKSDDQNYFWYRFMDTWNGWTKLRIPMHVEDGRFSNDGFQLHRVTHGNPSWSHVTNIEIRTEASNINKEGNFGIGSLVFKSQLESNIINFADGREPLHLSNSVLISTGLQTNLTTTASYYPGVPFTMHSSRDGYDIHYINILPIIAVMESQNQHSPNELADLKRAFESVDIGIQKIVIQQRTKQEGFNGGFASFGSMKFEGATRLESESALINLSHQSIDIRTESGIQSFQNVHRIVVSSAGSAEIRSTKGEVLPGLSFYSRVVTESPAIDITASATAPAEVVLEYYNGSRVEISGDYVRFTPVGADMLVRRPTITCECMASFRTFTAFGEIRDKIGLEPADLRLHGSMRLHLFISDQLTVADFAEIDYDKIERTPPLYDYNEFEAIIGVDENGRPKMSSVALVMAPLSAIIYFVVARSRHLEH
jgi:hypothetical protein